MRMVLMHNPTTKHIGVIVALAALCTVMQQCVACHAAYRLH